MLRFVHFDISADEPERAAKFYAEVFGWKTTKWDGPMDYWMVSTGPDNEPGINGGIARRKDPAERVTNTIDVPSVDEFVEKIIQSGGKVTAPKMPIQSVGYFALCLDTEGNPFGIMEEDLNAK